MSIYGQFLEEYNEDIMLEAILSKDIIDLMNNWKTSNQIHKRKMFKSNQVFDKDFEKISNDLKIIKETDSYEEYKKAFARFCYFCHIVPRGVIITLYKLKKGKEPDKNEVYVEYTENTRRIELPDTVNLYHMSKVGGITELEPQFRGKSEMGFLYPKKRVYFTIKKHMSKRLADYSGNQKLHKYVCKEKIKYAYVDPLLWSKMSGAVYVETDKPIKVEEITKNNMDRILKDEDPDKNVNESFDMENFLEFVTDNELEIVQDEEYKIGGE